MSESVSRTGQKRQPYTGHSPNSYTRLHKNSKHVAIRTSNGHILGHSHSTCELNVYPAAFAPLITFA